MLVTTALRDFGRAKLIARPDDGKLLMTNPGFGSPLRACFRLSVIFGAILPFTLTLFILRSARVPGCGAFKRWAYKCVNWLVGIRIECRGRPTSDRPTLFVANHISYFDIPILMELLDARFVAKASVRGWPMIGWAAAAQGTIFVERQRRATKQQANEVRACLLEKGNLLFFPEGTSSDGLRVLPFKSTLFSAAEERIEGKAVGVQPVSITYAKLDGLPMGRYLRPFFAWYGDMEFIGHIYRALSLGIATIIVEFHEPVTIDSFADRKALSCYCHEKVSHGLAVALAGRHVELLERGPVVELEPEPPAGKVEAA
jgi:1-acyl-sn-glycerol-3-phosphate acyltransferase